MCEYDVLLPRGLPPDLGVPMRRYRVPADPTPGGFIPVTPGERPLCHSGRNGRSIPRGNAPVRTGGRHHRRGHYSPRPYPGGPS